MTPSDFVRRLPCCLAILVLGLPLLAACGGGGGSGGDPNDADLMVVYFSHRSRTDVYRNQLLEVRFSAPVKASTVDDRTFRVLSGPNMQTPVEGARIVDGDRVYFDPTRSQAVFDRDGVGATADRPFGFEALTNYVIYLPGPTFPKTLKNLAGDPIVAEWIGNFTTSNDYIPEYVMPTFLGYSFAPPPNPDGSIYYNAAIELNFDEAIDPTSFDPGTTLEVWRDIDIQTPNGVVTKSGPYPVQVTISPDGRKFTLRPSVNWGSEARVRITVTDGIRDLAGNPIVPRPQNPHQTNPFVFVTEYRENVILVDFITETFIDNVYEDTGNTDADWNVAEEGALLGGAIITNLVGVNPQPNNQSTFLFNPSWPLVADPANSSCPLYPTGVSWAKGIRLQNSFTLTEIGPRAAITEVAWSPSSNWTFAATHPDIELRLGHAKTTTAVLGTDLKENFRDGVPLPNYNGQYSVATNGNVPNTTNGYPWVPFPTLTTPFDFDGTVGLIADYQISPAGTCQAWKCWAYTFLTGGPGRRAAGAQDRNAESDDGFITWNGATPELVFWTRFTKRRRVTQAQSKFYDTEIATPDYDKVVVTPSSQAGGATYVLELQGADAKNDPTSPTGQSPDLDTLTQWSTEANSLDGKQYLRFRFTMFANLSSDTVPRITSIQVPYIFEQN